MTPSREGAHAQREELLERPDGARLYTVSRGSGPTVVLAHGYLLEHVVFDEVAALLVQRGYRVIAFDQRGHGRSTVGSNPVCVADYVADYEALLAHYDARDATLVAHSVGSFLAFHFCLQLPEVARVRLSRLVVVGGNAGAVGVGSLQNRLQIPLLRTGLIRWLWSVRALGVPMVKALFGPSALSAHVETTRQILLRQDVRTTLPLLEAMLHEDLYPKLAAITIPATIISGECDKTCPRWHSERLGRELGRAENVWVKGIGHMLMLEAPDALVRAVTAVASDQQPLATAQ